MNMIATAEGVVVLLCFSVVLVVFSLWLPWIARLVALYGLHGLRDRLYGVAREYPQARTSHLYRDMELHLCASIKLVRDGRYREVLWLSVMVAGRRRSEFDENAQQRLDAYVRDRDDLFTGLAGQRAHDQIVSLSTRVNRFYQVYAFGGHPLMQLVSVAWAVVRLLQLPSRWLAPSRLPEEQLSRVLSASMKARDRVAVSSGPPWQAFVR